MAASRGRGKVNLSELKKEEKALAGPKQSPASCESAMDDYLQAIDMFRKPVAKDGSCLFRVVSEQIYQTQAKHALVRRECIEYMRRHKEKFDAFIEGSFEHHLYALGNPKEWGGQVEISALSHLYKRDFIVYRTANEPPQQVTGNGYHQKIHLCYLNGNHYDSVYPMSFKSNAAMAQSMLYDLLMDQVFPAIEKKTLAGSSGKGWTEVKTKCKGKSIDDAIMNAIPDAEKNQKIFWQIKRSLDPNIYRNIELEVWEENKSTQQKMDHTMAATVQFKPGDLCLATIKESKDVSATVRVKIQEINPDKCRVVSEDYRQQYYVQLNDLQVIVNGDYQESYKTLPGYYNKLETEAEFQAQRRRGKNRRFRDEDSRKHDGVNSQRSEKETRNSRRAGRKEADRKKDLEKDAKQALPKTKDGKKVDEATVSLTPDESVNGIDEVVKVANPAESPAAFWGRMRINKIPTNSQTKVPANTDAHHSVSSDEIFDGDMKPIKVNKPKSFDTIPDSSNDTILTTNNHSNMTHTVTFSNMPHAVTPSNSTNSASLPDATFTTTSVSTTETPSKSITSHTPLSVTSIPEATSSVVISSPEVAEITKLNRTRKSTSTPAVLPFKSAWGNLPTQISNEKLSLDISASSITTPALNTPTTTTSRSNVRNTPSPIIDTQKFNLSTQASIKVNQVHENILAKSAKITTNISADSLQQINNELRSRSPNLAVTSLIQNSSDDLRKDSSNVEQQSLSSSQITNVSTDPTESEFNKDINNDFDVSTADETQGRSIHSETKPETIPDTDNETTPTLKVKKKVSFGVTTEIHEKQEQIVTQADRMNASPLLSHSEPGKIVLPPDHREKHMTDFPSHDMIQHQVPHPAPHFIQQASFIPYYHLQNYPAPPMIPIFPTLNDQVHMPAVLSRDLEGKDLPEDVATLRYFYNLGVQFQLMNLQNSLQLNQPGILPLPVQHQAVPIRPMVMTSEHSNMRSADVYVPNHGQTNETSVMEFAHPNAILTNRITSTHAFNVPLQTTPSYEEYEIPPRLRRGPQNRGNARFFHHRPMFSGRGIMGQAPRPRSDFIRTANQVNYQT